VIGAEPGRYTAITTHDDEPDSTRAATHSKVVGCRPMLTGDRRMPAAAMMATPPWLIPSDSLARRVRGRACSTTEYPSAHRRRIATESA